MPRKKSKGTGGPRAPEQLMRYLANEMERQKNAQSLNDNVIVPFIAALEDVCGARGYVLNIYGEKSNLAFTDESDAEQIYRLIEAYLDEKGEN